MGHSSVAFTMDRYAHLLPDSQADTVAMIDAFLSRADSASRVAALITFCARGTGGFC